MRPVIELLPVIATRRRTFVETVVWSVVGQVLLLGLSLGLAWAVGRVLAGLPVPLGAAGAVLAGVALVASLVSWRESWVGHDLAYRLIATLRGQVFDALRLALPVRTSARRTGDLTTTVLADIETLEWLYAHTVAQSLSALVVLVLSAAVSIAIHPLLLCVWVPLLIIGVVVPQITARRATRDGDQLASGAAALRSDVLDTIRGMRELTGSGALERQLNQLTADTDALARVQIREASRMGLERAIAELALAIAVLGAIGIVVVDRASIAPESIPLAVTVAVAGLGPAAQIADLLRNAATLRAASVRITEVLRQPPAVEPGPVSGSASAAESGLVFDRVGFAYDSVRVLEEFSARISPGEVVALVGPSGAGKSTAARLALRMWDPDSGEVRVDGTSVARLSDDDLRALVAVVPQSSPLLRGTIRSNIMLGDPHASHEALDEAARAAGIFDPVSGLPAGLGTPVGEHGHGLSGGQRARVAIARALLRDPRVLVLDEPTASLDPDADRAVMDLLKRSRTRAILLIAHRPATIAAADRAITLGRASASE